MMYWLVEFLPADVEERGAFDGIPRSAPGVSREFAGAHGWMEMLREGNRLLAEGSCGYFIEEG